MGRWGYKGEGMKDQEIRDAVENIAGYLEHDSLFGEYEKNVLPILLNLAQQYLSIKGMPVEKRENYQDRPYQLGYQDGSNDTLKDCKLAVMKMFSVERIVEVIKDGKYYKGNIYEQLQHYSNGDCDEKNLIKDIAQAIHNLINEEEK